ncbi:hypothetical protein EBT16_02265 [bacterium]|nr:hypothetical protein [bacterium]
MLDQEIQYQADAQQLQITIPVKPNFWGGLFAFGFFCFTGLSSIGSFIGLFFALFGSDLIPLSKFFWILSETILLTSLTLLFIWLVIEQLTSEILIMLAPQSIELKRFVYNILLWKKTYSHFNVTSFFITELEPTVGGLGYTRWPNFVFLVNNKQVRTKIRRTPVELEPVLKSVQDFLNRK